MYKESHQDLPQDKFRLQCPSLSSFTLYGKCTITSANMPAQGLPRPDLKSSYVSTEFITKMNKQKQNYKPQIIMQWSMIDCQLYPPQSEEYR